MLTQDQLDHIYDKLSEVFETVCDISDVQEGDSREDAKKDFIKKSFFFLKISDGGMDEVPAHFPLSRVEQDLLREIGRTISEKAKELRVDFGFGTVEFLNISKQSEFDYGQEEAYKKSSE